MTGNVEDIIKNKAYFELNAEELEAVKEYATTEEEYEDMKWFLLNVGEAVQASKIEASADLKGRVMETLTATTKSKGSWMNSTVVFLFPQDKRFYQKPAFQMFVAAAIIILGIFIVDPFRGMDETSGLAMNEDKQEEIASVEEEPEVLTETGEYEPEADGRVTNQLNDGTIRTEDERFRLTEDMTLLESDEEMTVNNLEMAPMEERLEAEEEDAPNDAFWSAGGSDGVSSGDYNSNNNAPAGNVGGYYDNNRQDVTGGADSKSKPNQQIDKVTANGGLVTVENKKESKSSGKNKGGKGKKKKEYSKRDEDLKVSDNEISDLTNDVPNKPVKDQDTRTIATNASVSQPTITEQKNGVEGKTATEGLAKEITLAESADDADEDADDDDVCAFVLACVGCGERFWMTSAASCPSQCKTPKARIYGSNSFSARF